MGSNISGQPPSMTLMPCARPYSVAASETAASAEGPMHPDVADAEYGALAHRLVGELRPGGDHHGVHAAGDGLEVGVAGVALDFVGVGVDGEHVVVARSQPLVDDIAAVILRIAGDAGDRDPLVGQKFGCGLFDLEHAPHLRKDAEGLDAPDASQPPTRRRTGIGPTGPGSGPNGPARPGRASPR